MNAAILSLSLATLLSPPVETTSTPTTRLYVCTVPPGADVKLDGKPVGKSNDLFVVPSGVRKMNVEVELDLHYPQRQEVEVRGGRITRVELKLNRRSKREAEQPVPAASPDAAAAVHEAVKTISTLADGDPHVGQALASLKGLMQATVVSETAKFLDSKDDTIRRSAVYILWQGKFASVEPAVPGLLQLCDHQEDLTRGMAALALGGNRVGRSLPILMKMATDDQSGYARRCAAYALGLLGNKDAIPCLKKALEDPEAMVRNNARAALRMIEAGQLKGAGTSKATLPVGPP